MWKVINNTKEFKKYLDNLSRIRQELNKERLSK